MLCSKTTTTKQTKSTKHMYFTEKGNITKFVFCRNIGNKYDILDLWNDDSEGEGEKEIKMVKLWEKNPI